MRVCKIWDAEYPWDVRVEKVCRALRADGHRIDLVARNRHRRPMQESLPEAVVHRLKPLPALGSGLDNALMFPAFFNPRWLGLIQRTASSRRSDVLLCRDLPLAPAAVYVGRRLGIPVVLDMAENYPAMTQDTWNARRQKPWDVLVRNPRLVRKTEEWVLHRVDHVLVVVEESADRIRALGVPDDRITIVSNTPSSTRIRAGPAPTKGFDEVLTLIYVGGMQESRGIGTVVEAVALCRARGMDVRAEVIGDGRARQDHIERAQELGLLGDHLVFRGFLPYEEALARAAEADIGLVPHFATEAVNTTIPNKIFDYMALGLPVIVSNAPPLERIVREHRVGEVFRSGDSEDLARAIAGLRDPGYRRECGHRGKEAILTRYHWEADADRLCSALRRVVEGEAAGGPASSALSSTHPDRPDPRGT